MASGNRFYDLQKFCRAVERAVSVPADENCREVERQLEILLSLSEASLSNGSEVPDTDSVSTLIKILSNPCTRSPISAYIMTALRMQSAKSDTIRDVMVGQLNVLLPLSLIITKDQDGEECLKLLQLLTYGIRVTCPNSCIEDIIRFVVNKITSPMQGSVIECLDVLANLCQRSVTVQAFVKGLPSVPTLQRRLLSNLSSANVSVVILSLHILASLFLTEELGTRIFSANNMEQSFQLAFSVLFAFSTNLAGATYAVDLLVDILSHERIHAILKQYGQLQDCLQKMVSLLPRVEGVMRAKMVELCVVLCRVSGLRVVMAKLLMQKKTTLVAGKNISTCQLATLLTDMTIPSAAFPNTTLIILDLLQEIIQEALNGAHTWDCMEQIKFTLEQVALACQPPDYSKGDDVIHICLVQVSKLLSIWSESVTKHILESIKSDYLQRLIQDQFKRNLTYSKEKSWMSVSMEVVILSVHLLLKHAKYSQKTKADVHSLLTVCLAINILQSIYVTLGGQDITCCSEQQLLPVIGHSLQSTNKMMVAVVLELLVEAQNAEGFDIGRLADVLTVINNSAKSEVLQQPAICPVLECGGKMFVPEKVVVDTAAVDELIQKFKNGLEIKDLKTSEIIDVYEHKLQAMHLKESHLQDLVDAKSLALTQADRLISQYRGRKAYTDEECLKLRTLLQDAERRSERLSDKVDELQKYVLQQTQERDSLKIKNNDLLHIAEEHKKVLEAFQEQTTKLEGTQQKLVSKDEQNRQLSAQLKLLQSNNEALNTQKLRLNEQVQGICEELQQLQERYHYSEDKCQSLQTALLEHQRKCKSLEDLKEALEGNIGSLNTKLKLSEQQIQSLNQECATQKDEVTMLKRNLSRLQGELQELRAENMKLLEEVNLFSAVKSLILKKP